MQPDPCRGLISHKCSFISSLCFAARSWIKGKSCLDPKVPLHISRSHAHIRLIWNRNKQYVTYSECFTCSQKQIRLRQLVVYVYKSSDQLHPELVNTVTLLDCKKMAQKRTSLTYQTEKHSFFYKKRTVSTAYSIGKIVSFCPNSLQHINILI